MVEIVYLEQAEAEVVVEATQQSDDLAENGVRIPRAVEELAVQSM